MSDAESVILGLLGVGLKKAAARIGAASGLESDIVREDEQLGAVLDIVEVVTTALVSALFETHAFGARHPNEQLR